MVKVSVLMPVYKTKEEYLREAIESILNQTFTDFEFLILDDCPDDDRESIVKSYDDKRIRYVKNEKNLGITPSRNKLIDLAKGEYLAVFDHDDISLPERFAKQVEYLDNHPEVGVVSSLVKNMSRGKVQRKPIDNDDIKIGLVRNCVVSHSAAMIRKSVLIDNNIRYEEKFSPAEDYALWCRLLPFTEFHNLDEVLFWYRDHENNTSHLQEDKMTDATVAIQSFIKFNYPELYQRYLHYVTNITKVSLFGIIPLISIVKNNIITKIYLFGRILLLNCIHITKLEKGKSMQITEKTNKFIGGGKSYLVAPLYNLTIYNKKMGEI